MAVFRRRVFCLSTVSYSTRSVAATGNLVLHYYNNFFKKRPIYCILLLSLELFTIAIQNRRASYFLTRNAILKVKNKRRHLKMLVSGHSEQIHSLMYKRNVRCRHFPATRYSNSEVNPSSTPFLSSGNIVLSNQQSVNYIPNTCHK